MLYTCIYIFIYVTGPKLHANLYIYIYLLLHDQQNWNVFFRNKQLLTLTTWRRTVLESTTNTMLFLWENNVNTGVKVLKSFSYISCIRYYAFLCFQSSDNCAFLVVEERQRRTGLCVTGTNQLLTNLSMKVEDREFLRLIG